MAGLNKGSSRYGNIVRSDSEEYSDGEESGVDLGVFLEKLNLGPKKKLLVLNLNGLIMRRVFTRNKDQIPKSRLMGNMEVILDQKKCTDSGFKSLEKKTKPLFFKDLKKVWEHVKKGGPYSESNTLLIDDKPYKALLNPPNTATFPETYNAEDKDDKVLEDELISYLEGVADAEDVQSYVKEHPFGQAAITSSHPDWDFFSKVLNVWTKNDVEVNE